MISGPVEERHRQKAADPWGRAHEKAAPRGRHNCGELRDGELRRGLNDIYRRSLTGRMRDAYDPVEIKDLSNAV